MTLLQPQRPRIGITGSSGKTSTVLMLTFILEYCGLNPAALDTWRGFNSYERFLREASTTNADCLLVETCQEALQQHSLAGDMFTCGALTNLFIDHLKNCGTPEHYYQIKTTFFNELPPQAYMVIPADDPHALQLTASEHQHFITYAVNYPHAMVTANNIHSIGLTSNFDLTVKADIITFSGRVVTPATAPVFLSMPGDHNIANALLASTLALLFVPDIEAVADALSRFPGIRRNMETICFDPFRVMDDAARNPASIQAVLTAAEALNPSQMLVLHGIYGGGGQTVNRCNARELTAWVQRNKNSLLFITRSMYHTKNKHQVRLGEEKAFLEELKAHNVDFFYFPDLPDACESILSHARENDLILLLGGPVLNRAREIIMSATGSKRAGHPLIPSDLMPFAHLSCLQAPVINAT